MDPSDTHGVRQSREVRRGERAQSAIIPNALEGSRESGKSPLGPRVCTQELPRLAYSPSQGLGYRMITPNALLLLNSRSDDSHQRMTYESVTQC